MSATGRSIWIEAGVIILMLDCGTGLTTEQMQQQDTFKRAGWDFGYTWAMPEGGYPVLRWELAEGAGPR
jgi:hypothetical protein